MEDIIRRLLVRTSACSQLDSIEVQSEAGRQ